MVIPTTPADLVVWAVIAVLLVLDWYIGGTVYNRPPITRTGRDALAQQQENPGEQKAA
jgi:hypothetical protein